MKRILIVDDSPTIRQQVSMALTQAGFAVAEAVDGVDDVRVTLEDGAMVVTSAAPLDFAAVEAAVAEAGDYQVALV